MERILYEYEFDWGEYASNFILLALGIGFLSIALSVIKEQKHDENMRGFSVVLLKVLGFTVGPFAILLFLGFTELAVRQYFEYKDLLETENIYSVMGYVENFHPMPYEGHDTEHFEVDGVYFEYSDYITTNGYNTAASHGGVVTRNGQYLKIKYIVEEYESGKIENIILYIAEITE